MGLERFPGSDAVGKSYDVFGYYASSRSVKEELFNLAPPKDVSVDGHCWKLSPDYHVIRVHDSGRQTFSVRTRELYSEKLAISAKLAGTYRMFSASVESDFSSHNSTGEDFTYTAIHSHVYKWKLALKDDVQGLRSKLKSSVRRNLAVMDPKELLETYGLYFLKAGLVGGRANYVARTRTDTSSSDISIRVAAVASFEFLADGKIDVRRAEQAESFKNLSTIVTSAIGGSAPATIRDHEKYSSWLHSIDDHPVFCGFSDDSFVPVWQLAESSDRQNELKAATEMLLRDPMMQDATVGLDVIVCDEKYSQGAGEGYELIDYDINKGVEGKYVYVCYKQEKVSLTRIRAGLECRSPITSIQVLSVDHREQLSVPHGYEWIDKDLNSGAGGKFISLCFSKNPTCGDPIRGLTFRDQNTLPPAGFHKIPQDLNQGCGEVVLQGVSTLSNGRI